MVHANKKFTGEEHWQNVTSIGASSYDCGYCSATTASGLGIRTEGNNAFVRICPNCNGPTFFAVDGSQWPGPRAGRAVSGLSEEVRDVYEEARTSAANAAFTGAVMLCRKILMYVAVDKGAKKDLTFQQYVEWLIEERHAPRGAEKWLDYIRSRGNDANHEIVVMNKDDAVGVLGFTENLLLGVYELPGLVPTMSSENPDEADSGTPEHEPEGA